MVIFILQIPVVFLVCVCVCVCLFVSVCLGECVHMHEVCLWFGVCVQSVCEQGHARVTVFCDVLCSVFIVWFGGFFLGLQEKIPSGLFLCVFVFFS